MNAELVKPKIQKESQETLHFTDGLITLQARFLLGGAAINPENTQVPEIKQEQIKSFPDRDYSAFNNTSTYNRQEEWRQKEAAGQAGSDFDAQYATWIDETTAILTAGENKEFVSKLKILSTAMGVNLENFTPCEAAKLYQRYFDNENLKKYEMATSDGSKVYLASDVKTFVADVLTAYRDQSSKKLNYEKLKADLTEIQCFAHIFGDTAAEVVTQLLDAEAKLQTQPESLVNDANKDSRRNAPAAKERKLAGYVWEHGNIKVTEPVEPSTKPAKPPAPPQEAGKPPPPTPPAAPEEPASTKEGRKISYYERPGEPRIFPEAFKLDEIDKPEYIAAELKKKFPDKYKDTDLSALAKQVEIDQQKGEKTLLSAIGMDLESFENYLSDNMEQFQKFCEQKYGIKSPSFDHIKIFPFSGKVAELYSDRTGIAYVIPTHPAIYIDTDKFISNMIKMRKRNPDLSAEDIIDTVLSQTALHEFRHLTSDLAYWYQVPYREGKVTLTAEERRKSPIQQGKSGLEVIKPAENYTKGVIRGELLNEAVTDKLVLEFSRYKRKKMGSLGYPNEIQVLEALENLIARQENTSPEEAFKLFARAQSDPDDFRLLAEKLSGKYKDKNGKVKFRRKSFLKTIYDRMWAEHHIAEKKQQDCTYPYTIKYIDLIDKKSTKDKLKLLINEIGLIFYLLTNKS